MTSGRSTEFVVVEKEIQVIFSGYDSPICIIGNVLGSILGIVTLIWIARNGAKAFKKSTGFAICLFFFPDICWLILGLGKAKYHKKEIEAE